MTKDNRRKVPVDIQAILGSPQLKQEIFDAFDKFLTDNPNTKTSLLEFIEQYMNARGTSDKAAT